MSDRYPETSDGRYFVVRGRLWRKSDPALDEATRNRLVKDLMSARRAVRDAKGDPDAMAKARHLVDDAKVALGERGAPWWEDGAPDYESAHGKKHALCRVVRQPRKISWRQSSRGASGADLFFAHSSLVRSIVTSSGAKCPLLECQCIIEGTVQPLFILVGL